MSSNRFTKSYESKSDMELIFVIENIGYTQEAINTATEGLNTRGIQKQVLKQYASDYFVEFFKSAIEKRIFPEDEILSSTKSKYQNKAELKRIYQAVCAEIGTRRNALNYGVRGYGG